VIVLKSEATRLIYVPNPKAASSSIYKVMLTLAGVDLSIPARKAFRSDRLSAGIRQAGVENVIVDAAKIGHYRKAHPDYFWFSFVRNPYDRVVSNYNNKLNRYAAEFVRNAYLVAKLKQIARGPRAWQSHLVCVDYLKRMISFDAYVRGLDEHGIDFDQHFRQQSRILRLANVGYDFIGKVEDFAKDIRTVAEAAKGGGGLDDGALPRENASRQDKRPDEFFTPELRDIVHRLYRPDFEVFGYPVG